ncbi:permease for cytosine/purines, uracil, thiamine, allantoin-domain-containing protein [Suillus lakei]|nr:permease for cytosine/purines, uracil, thiamine, allantoin-domain-containing protein [Suillus lakei]
MSVEQGELRKDRGARLLACRPTLGTYSLRIRWKLYTRPRPGFLMMRCRRLEWGNIRWIWLDVVVTGLILTSVVNESNILGPWLKLAQNIGLLVGAAFWGISSDVWGWRWAFIITLGMTGLFAIAAGGLMNYVALCSLTAVWSNLSPLLTNICSSFVEPLGNVFFIIFWVMCLSLLLLKPESYRVPAMIAAVLVLIATLAVFLWAIVKQGNGGPLFSNPDGIGGWAGGSGARSLARHGSLTGRALFDFSRYTVRPGDQVYGQAIQRNEVPVARAAVFFAAFAFFSSQLSVMVVACGVVGEMDLAALCPRTELDSYIDIRRGSLIIAVIGICINPWKIMNTANSFISAISGYAVFLGPLTGIMFADYHLLRHRRIKLSHLFLPQTGSDYWFWHGLNWRAPVAWVLGVWASLPGFCASVTQASVIIVTPGCEVDDSDVFGTFQELPDPEDTEKEKEEEPDHFGKSPTHTPSFERNYA